MNDENVTEMKELVFDLDEDYSTSKSKKTKSNVINLISDDEESDVEK